MKSCVANVFVATQHMEGIPVEVHFFFRRPTKDQKETRSEKTKGRRRGQDEERRQEIFLCVVCGSFFSVCWLCLFLSSSFCLFVLLLSSSLQRRRKKKPIAVCWFVCLFVFSFFL